jgi:hypothetical protein
MKGLWTAVWREILDGIRATPEFLYVLIFLAFISAIALATSLFAYFGS